MGITICYIIVYLVEAFIIKQYCTTLFFSRRAKLAEWITTLLIYSILFGISFIENALLNTAAFFIFNAIFIFFLYDVKWTSALFHAMIATVAMSTSELVIVGIISNLATNYYKSDTYLENLIILLVSSKPLYFWCLYFISHILIKNKIYSLIG